MSEANVSEVRIQESDFDIATEYRDLQLRAPNAGAIVFFVGLVRDLYERLSPTRTADSTLSSSVEPRDSFESSEIDYIELSHYSGMTEAMCEQIVEEAKQRCDIDAVKIVHRVGKLYAGDQIVFVAVASRHRDEAFLASQFIMDYLKTRATIWKKEVGTRGEKWLGVKDKDEDAAKRWSK